MIKKIEPRIMSGFMELLPAEQLEFNRFLDIVRKTYEEFGFVPLDTPVIELSEVLLAKVGEDTKKEIYRFNRGDDDLSLRFDLTVPLARYVSMYGQKINFPFRRYQIGKSFRGERPQRGRFREFYQCDVDIIGQGELSLANDAEVLSVMNRVFSKLNIGEYIIKISNRKILNGLVSSFGWPDKVDEVLRIVDKLEKIGEQTTTEELLVVGLDLGAVKKVIEFVKIKGSNKDIFDKLKKMSVVNEDFESGIKELEEVVRLALQFGTPEENLQVDLSIARGLAYYTGMVCETKLLDERVVGSVCSGGRYDNLAESFSNQSYPGVGISIGLTRLFSQLLDSGVIAVGQSTPSRVLVVSIDNDLGFALEVATQFRDAEVPSEVYTETDKFKKKLNYANRIGVPYVAIIGENELKERNVSLKNMKTGEQETLFIEEAIKVLKRI